MNDKISTQPHAKVTRDGALVSLTVGLVAATMTPDQADLLAEILRKVAREVRNG